jgi:hypothetical protein
MWRVSGIPTSLPGALHTVALQHISTLHNASGRHILCCIPAQVKHPLFSTKFFALNRSTVDDFFSDRVRALHNDNSCAKAMQHARSSSFANERVAQVLFHDATIVVVVKVWRAAMCDGAGGPP